VPGGAHTFLSWVTVAVILGTALVALSLFRGTRIGRALVPARLAALASESRAQLRRYVADPETLALVLVASLAYQALASLQLVMLADAIGVHLPFATAAVTLALVTIVTLIPISIGGFGVREGTYVVLLSGASISATDATLISLLTVAVLFFASLPGAFLLAYRGVSPVLEGTA
jgi:uncharacterized membrane protein YbhN (UPF0104 family)